MSGLIPQTSSGELDAALPVTKKRISLVSKVPFVAQQPWGLAVEFQTAEALGDSW